MAEIRLLVGCDLKKNIQDLNRICKFKQKSLEQIFQKEFHTILHVEKLDQEKHINLLRFCTQFSTGKKNIRKNESKLKNIKTFKKSMNF